jgi:hypothetical protein
MDYYSDADFFDNAAEARLIDFPLSNDYLLL